MAAVKNRLKIFEADTDTGNMAGTKPQTPLKPPIFGQKMTPALQKFMNKQNEVIGDKEGQGSNCEAEDPVKKTPDVLVKGSRNGLTSGANAEQDENNTPVFPAHKTVVTRPSVGAVKLPENRRGSQVNVPSVFKQDSISAAVQPESRRGSQVNVSEVFKQSLQNTNALSEINSLDENKKPKPGFAYSRPPPGPKPGNTPAPHLPSTKKPSDFKSEEKEEQLFPRESIKVKLPAMDQLAFKNIHSSLASGTSLATSSVMSHSSPPSQEKVTDFRSMLKPTKTQPANQSAGTLKLAAIKPVFPPATCTSSRVSETEAIPASDHGTSASDGFPVASLANDSRQDEPVSQTQLKRQSNSNIVERKSDSKMFKKVKLEVFRPTSAPPQKPSLPGNVDLALVKQQYHKTIQILRKESDMSNIKVDEEDGDVYDDGTSVADVVTRESSVRQSSVRKQSERISVIPDMSAEEEEGVLYDDGETPLPPPPLPEADEMYVDAETERKDDDLDQLYEDEETFVVSPEKLEEEKKRRQKEEAEAKKKEEKERKEKEKEEEKKRKKEEKEKAKKEKEEMQLRKKFSLTGEETSAGEGIIKQDVRGGVLGGLSLKKGQTVTIVRLDNNPQNKWLIRSDTGMGYIDSSVIEVDPGIIRQAMANQAKGAYPSKEDDDQPLYDDVPQDGVPNDLDDGEIYEECP